MCAYNRVSFLKHLSVAAIIFPTREGHLFTGSSSHAIKVKYSTTILLKCKLVIALVSKEKIVLLNKVDALLHVSTQPPSILKHLSVMTDLLGSHFPYSL